MEKIVIIIPTYNEKENITSMIEVLENDIFSKIKDFIMFVLVVDDNSPDGTSDKVITLKKKYDNLQIICDTRKGLGMAYRRGIIYAVKKMGADVVIKMDADFQHDPIYVLELLEKYRQGYKYVIGSRFISGGSVPKEWGAYRKILSKYGGLCARIILFFQDIKKIRSIGDISSGFALASVSDVLKKIDLSQLSSGFNYSPQLIFQIVNIGIEIAEVPIMFGMRVKGKTKMPFSNIPATLYAMITLRLFGRRIFKNNKKTNGLLSNEK
jgi:dolichol-phosphate mannosyltransferase